MEQQIIVEQLTQLLGPWGVLLASLLWLARKVVLTLKGSYDARTAQIGRVADELRSGVEVYRETQAKTDRTLEQMKSWLMGMGKSDDAWNPDDLDDEPPDIDPAVAGNGSVRAVP